MYVVCSLDALRRRFSADGGDLMVHLMSTEQDALAHCASSSTSCAVIDIGFPQECTVVESRISNAQTTAGEFRDNAVYDATVWPHQSLEAIINGAGQY